MKEKEKEWIENTRRQIDERRTSVEVAKTKGLNTRIRKKGYSMSVEGSHGSHWYGKTGSESPVNPTVQAYVVGWVQLPNLQKLAEQQSCYSSPKENLIEDKIKEKETTHKEIRRKTTLDKTVGKKKLTWWCN